jgi:sugar lactone lactonase YvrE
MTIDPDNRFAKSQMPSGSGWEIARAGEHPTLLLASDFPLAIGRDGNLYYPKASGKDRVEILKMAPSGGSSVLASLSVPWVNGLAAGPDGSLYVTEDAAIRKIDKQGRVATVVADVKLAGCASIPGSDPKEGPYLRGLDVDSQGTIVVAAAGCGRVLKVTPDGKAVSLVQVEAPWSPTAVVHVGGDVYVLEYFHVATEDRRLWIPRIRKISPDGKSAVIVTVRRP